LLFCARVITFDSGCYSAKTTRPIGFWITMLAATIAVVVLLGDLTRALPEDFAFPLPEAPQSVATVGPQQSRIVSATVDEYVDDAEVADIKISKGRALYVWGRIEYEDAFKEPRFTNFCLSMFWLSDAQILGYFNHRHNDSD
jgi:hypothetical protein